VDYKSTAIDLSAGAGKLCIDSYGFYYYNISCQPSNTAKFKRKIIISQVRDSFGNPIDYIVDIKAQVSWDARPSLLNPTGALAGTCGPYNCITTEETLYDWYNYANH